MAYSKETSSFGASDEQNHVSGQSQAVRYWLWRRVRANPDRN